MITMMRKDDDHDFTKFLLQELLISSLLVNPMQKKIYFHPPFDPDLPTLKPKPMASTLKFNIPLLESDLPLSPPHPIQNFNRATSSKCVKVHGWMRKELDPCRCKF